MSGQKSQATLEVQHKVGTPATEGAKRPPLRRCTSFTWKTTRPPRGNNKYARQNAFEDLEQSALIAPTSTIKQQHPVNPPKLSTPAPALCATFSCERNQVKESLSMLMLLLVTVNVFFELEATIEIARCTWLPLKPVCEHSQDCGDILNASFFLSILMFVLASLNACLALKVTIESPWISLLHAALGVQEFPDSKLVAAKTSISTKLDTLATGEMQPRTLRRSPTFTSKISMEHVQPPSECQDAIEAFELPAPSVAITTVEKCQPCDQTESSTSSLAANTPSTFDKGGATTTAGLQPPLLHRSPSFTDNVSLSCIKQPLEHSCDQTKSSTSALAANTPSTFDKGELRRREDCSHLCYIAVLLSLTTTLVQTNLATSATPFRAKARHDGGIVAADASSDVNKSGISEKHGFNRPPLRRSPSVTDKPPNAKQPFEQKFAVDNSKPSTSRAPDCVKPSHGSGFIPANALSIPDKDTHTTEETERPVLRRSPSFTSKISMPCVKRLFLRQDAFGCMEPHARQLDQNKFLVPTRAVKCSA
ncbi:hypothetical protein AeNC1_011817 [Aphanomyces euteiches]|nr:hypothetical protein AeNC1_011817 [Aphanomyces euteiches]